MSAKLPLRFQ